MIIIESEPGILITEDAINTFPDECCGFVFGMEDENQNRIITEILVVENSKQGEKTRRFEISPLDYLRAEQYAMDNELLLLGIFHSHPNHPAIPSEHDRIAAQPYFSYLIISVMNREIAGIRSWKLNEKEQFDEEKIADYQFT